jgi:hypothetical protein
MIFNFKKFFIGLLFLSIPIGLLSKTKTQLFSIKDLSILEKQKNYEEFLNHALDLRPSQRNKRWRNMVQNMATGYISSLIKRKQFTQKYFLFIESLLSWPTLKTDEFFLIKRNRYGIHYLKNCFKKNINHKPCSQKLLNFWYNNKDPELGLKLGQIIQKSKVSLEVWKFYSKATLSPFSKFYCKDKFLQRAFFKKISLVLEKEELHEKAQLKALNFLAHPNCWSLFLPLLKRNLFSNQQIYREHTFKILDLKKFLSREEKDSFLTFYILKGPLVGQIFNQAWNTVKELGQSYIRRANVLQKLKYMDPLPDDIFALSHSNKRKTLVDFMYRNIPEYFSLYSKTCLKYLKGSKFKIGNPTLYCKEFFKLSQNGPWPSLHDKIEYKKIIKK